MSETDINIQKQGAAMPHQVRLENQGPLVQALRL